MASWNEKRVGDELEPCPVCFVNVSKRRLTCHVTKCYETYQETIDERGLIKCPLYPLHILPKRYLNHHLEGNCQEAQNMLRKYFQKTNLMLDLIKVAPATFLCDVPDDMLNKNNKQLLYTLGRDLNGNPYKDPDEDKEYQRQFEEDNERDNENIGESIDDNVD